MINQPEPPWWTDLDPDWTQDDVDELVSLLVDAYPGLTPLLSALKAIEFNVWAELSSSTPPEEIWTATLRHAVMEKQIDQLITALLDDQWEKASDDALIDLLERVAESNTGLEGIISDNDEPTDGISFI